MSKLILLSVLAVGLIAAAHGEYKLIYVLNFLWSTWLTSPAYCFLMTPFYHPNRQSYWQTISWKCGCRDQQLSGPDQLVQSQASGRCTRIRPGGGAVRNWQSAYIGRQRQDGASSARTKPIRWESLRVLDHRRSRGRYLSESRRFLVCITCRNLPTAH